MKQTLELIAADAAAADTATEAAEPNMLTLANDADPEFDFDRPRRPAAQGWDALWPAGVPRRGRLRVRTLTTLRWVAVAGQIQLNHDEMKNSKEMERIASVLI